MVLLLQSLVPLGDFDGENIVHAFSARAFFRSFFDRSTTFPIGALVNLVFAAEESNQHNWTLYL